MTTSLVPPSLSVMDGYTCSVPCAGSCLPCSPKVVCWKQLRLCIPTPQLMDNMFRISYLHSSMLKSLPKNWKYIILLFTVRSPRPAAAAAPAPPPPSMAPPPSHPLPPYHTSNRQHTHSEQMIPDLKLHGIDPFNPYFLVQSVRT